MKEYLLISDVARMLGVSSSRVHQMVVQGDLQYAARTPGGVRLFSIVEVEKVKQRRATARS